MCQQPILRSRYPPLDCAIYERGLRVYNEEEIEIVLSGGAYGNKQDNYETCDAPESDAQK
ncbi:hypothetical protein D3C77_789680 [compost metagenome]